MVGARWRLPHSCAVGGAEDDGYSPSSHDSRGVRLTLFRDSITLFLSGRKPWDAIFPRRAMIGSSKAGQLYAGLSANFTTIKWYVQLKMEP